MIKNIKRYINIMIFIIIILVIWFIKPESALAKEVSFQVYPSIKTVLYDAKATPAASFTVKNNSYERLDLQISIKPVSQKNDGTIELRNPSQIELEIIQNIAIISNNKNASVLSLKPLEAKEITVYVPLKNNQYGSDYYLSILFSATPEYIDQEDKPSSTSYIRPTVGTLLLLSKKTNKQAVSVSLETPVITLEAPVVGKVALFNKTNHLALLNGNITAQALLGFSKQNETLNQILLGKGEKLLTISLGCSNEQTKQGQMVFCPGIPLGIYRISFTYDLDGNKITKSNLVFVSSASAITWITVGLVFTLIIAHRVKKHLK